MWNIVLQNTKNMGHKARRVNSYDLVLYFLHRSFVQFSAVVCINFFHHLLRVRFSAYPDGEEICGGDAWLQWSTRAGGWFSFLATAAEDWLRCFRSLRKLFSPCLWLFIETNPLLPLTFVHSFLLQPIEFRKPTKKLARTGTGETLGPRLLKVGTPSFLPSFLLLPDIFAHPHLGPESFQTRNSEGSPLFASPSHTLLQSLNTNDAKL